VRNRKDEEKEFIPTRAHLKIGIKYDQLKRGTFAKEIGQKNLTC